MVLVICVLSIMLILSIVLITLLLRALKNIFKGIQEREDLEEELAFLQGEIDIDEDRILRKFPDAILLCHLEQDPSLGESDTIKIFDISNYSKNHIIGLTYFVQPQFFEDLKNSVKMKQMRDRLRQKFMEDNDIDPDEADIDFINSILDEAIGEVLEEEFLFDEKAQTMTRPLLPHCTVYQLKDGRWLWRQELD